MPDRRPKMLACSEDEPIAWYERSSCSRLGAIRGYVDDVGIGHLWSYFVRAEHMRPFTEADCKAKQHGRDADGDPLDDDCRCLYQEDEGQFYICKNSHPDAIAVWRVEELEAPSWWYRFRRRTKKLHPAIRRAYKPVLWGGRPQRWTNRFDRILLGRGHRVLAGTSPVQLGRGSIEWCPTCRMETLHHVARWPAEPDSPNPRRRKARDTRRCEADGHFDRLEEASKPRWVAPIANDIREAS